ncbi:MAG: hypothetical protein KAS64_03120 [Spirochaetes bacterium]|nr:hypothetical protein [Spirochaetota bacterium]
MSLPLDKLLDENINRYELCSSAIKISRKIAATWSPEDIAATNEKLAVLSMRKLLDKEVTIKKNVNDLIKDDELIS